MTRPIAYGSLRRRATLAAICALPMMWMIVAGAGGQTTSAPADLLITNGKVYAADGSTGVLKESAQALVRKVLPQPSRDDQRAALRAAIAEALKFGLTSVQNASGSPEELEIFDEAQRAGDLKVRYYSTLSIQPGFTQSEADRYDQVWRRYGDSPVLKTGAIKIVLDGVIESRTAGMR